MLTINIGAAIYKEDGFIEFHDDTDKSISEIFDFNEVIGEDTLKGHILRRKADGFTRGHFSFLTDIHVDEVIRTASFDNLVSDSGLGQYYFIRQFLHFCKWDAQMLLRKREFVSEVAGYDLVRECHNENIGNIGYVEVKANIDFSLDLESPQFIEGDYGIDHDIYTDLTNKEVIQAAIGDRDQYTLKETYTIIRFAADKSVIPLKSTEVI